jgi:UDP-N-acetylglucosamine--dolichyl-phosphate N-acetylglucosaminephosphotransferase
MVDSFASGNLILMITIIAAIFASVTTTLVLVPRIMKKMKERGFTGIDWNKKDKTEIPELGGIAILFGFPIGISIATGMWKLFGPGFSATPILAAIGVLFIAGMIGIIDGISGIPQRVKAVVLAFAALPLIIAGIGSAVIDLPFGIEINLAGTEELRLIFWMIIVPIAITGAANAMNMSAGYNGLESGQIAIISLSLLVLIVLQNGSIEAGLIFAALFGAAVGLNYYNGYPAVTFVGDVGTLSMGAVIGASAIIGSVEFASVIAISPAFFEGFSTAYYSFVKKINRKAACAAPIIDEEGKLHAPKGAEKYTLGYWILSKKPMTERNLVRTILGIYAVSGLLAILFSGLM